MFYNTGNSLGVIEVEPGHTKGSLTYLPAYENHALGPWIFSEDLHETHEEAKSAGGARWHREKKALKAKTKMVLRLLFSTL